MMRSTFLLFGPAAATDLLLVGYSVFSSALSYGAERPGGKVKQVAACGLAFFTLSRKRQTVLLCRLRLSVGAPYTYIAKP
ncbi:MAG TPA: hypothetical protein VMG10_18970, partial [Gemmataceae bacterium]|nr:hypothetical protein [Gemmataceae bacterium]